MSFQAASQSEIAKCFRDMADAIERGEIVMLAMTPRMNQERGCAPEWFCELRWKQADLQEWPKPEQQVRLTGLGHNTASARPQGCLCDSSALQPDDACPHHGHLLSTGPK